MKPPQDSTVTGELWQRISDVFADALELPAAERSSYLRRECAGDECVEREVRRLLSESDCAGEFLETPALDRGALSPESSDKDSVSLEGDVLAGRFHVIRMLGAGGMGEVYEAYDSELRQRVAIKTLRRPGVVNSATLDRFRSEVMLARQITHPGVGPVYDLFTHTRPDGSQLPFFTMKLLEGETLSQWMVSHGPLSPAQALPLLEQMAAALHAAHLAGIVHRDFKPGNVFISEPAGKATQAIVTDFGIAAQHGSTSHPGLSQTSASGASLVAGTPAYMSPEQIVGEPGSAASDIYSLGLVACEMLTGKRAYAAESSLACALQKLAPEDPELFSSRSGFPPVWVDAIHRAVRRNPEKRFANTLDFIRAISPKEKALSRRVLVSRGFWGILLIAAVISGGVAFVLGRNAPLARTAASIAVLPFDNASGDSQLSYLSDGIAEELTHALSTYPKLHVVSQASAFGFRNGATPPAKIGRALGVEMLLTGSVRRSEGRLHISVQLVHGATGREVWSQIYDRELRQVYAVEGEITNEVVARLAPGPATRKSAREPTSNPDAYDLYLKGRYLWNTRTREGLLKGVEYFEQAIRMDSSFALAYAALADSYTVLADYAWISPIVAAPKVRTALDHALSLDPESADIQTSLGLFDSLLEWDQAGAERAFRRALSVNPSLMSAHSWYANYLMRAGRLDEALREAEVARRLDPVSLPTLGFLGWVRYYRKEYPAAIEIGKQVLAGYASSPYGYYLLALS
ncbi:MAG TPA: protein kinase, partial [Bryobacteraceae bacterium]|nr:protein kinase [Bryobacteraceae bacterium]